MSFCLSFHLALLGATGAHWQDAAPDLSSRDSTQEYSVDDPLLSCKQQALCLGRELSGDNPVQHGGLGGIVRRLGDTPG
jgi:hypothetical protein